MNKHILFTMKWLDNPKQFTDEQINDNWKAAYHTYTETDEANRGTAAAHGTAYTAANSAANSAADADADVYADASFYIDKYFKITGEDRQLYLDQIELDKQVVEQTPDHYQMLGGIPTIDMVARSLTQEQWQGFCLGNVLKYRIRAGKKGCADEDLAKADHYEELYEQHKDKCIEVEL